MAVRLLPAEGPQLAIGGSEVLWIMETVTLFRPVGPKELELIKAFGFRALPPRLPDQPIFYPVANHAYATQIARDYSAVPGPPLAELAADLKVV